MVNALLALAGQLTNYNLKIQKVQYKNQQRWPALIQIEVVLELE
jgi:hypothetical protein